MSADRETATSPPPLWGLVLAGGAGRRLGRDKGLLDYHGVPQARWAYDRLARLSERVYVSVRADQADKAPYAELPLIVDVGASDGPASGLSSAWAAHSGVAWLVLAADMPLVSATVLADLVAARDPSALATAFRHADGTIEPLCAVWEPAAAALIGPDRQGGSLRRVLQGAPVRLLDIGDPAQLRSVNTPQDDSAARVTLSR
jgi:molybdenum cofactor guanylyltransferase